ncbi:MAG: hypothetical protein ACE5Q6_15480 [Dehalococcoidia bacterium]
MNAPETRSQSKLQSAYQEIKKDQEQIEMRLKIQTTKVRNWLSKGLLSQHPAKILGVVALVGLTIAVTGLQFTPILGDEPKNTAVDSVLIPGAPAALVGFTPNQQVEILGEMDDFGDIGATSYQPVLVPGAPAALVGFTPNQQVEILGEMDDFGDVVTGTYE